jgi:hypothetical protein
MRTRTDRRIEEVNAFQNAAAMEQILARDRVIAAAANLVAAERTAEDGAGAQATPDEAVLAYAKALALPTRSSATQRRSKPRKRPEEAA